MHQNIEFNLVLRLLNLSQTGSLTITDDHSIDWALFYQLVIRHHLWFHAHRALKINEPSPAAVDSMNSIARLCDTDTQHLLRTAAETIRISRLFIEHSIQHCFIKGILLNTSLYGGLYTRPCSDIDLWVDHGTYDAAVEILLALGYQKKLTGYVLEGFKKTYYFKHRHDLAFYHPERKILVELHFRLEYLSSEFFSFSEVKLQSIDLMNHPTLTLSDPYHLLYLMIHGAIHGWSSLRWLHDIALHIRSNRCDFDLIFQLAKQMQCEAIVEQTLLLVYDFFQMHQVLPWIKSPSKRSIELADLAKTFILTDYTPKDGFSHIPMFMKRRLYLFKMANRGKKLKALLSDFIKLDEIFNYVTFRARSSNF